MGRDRQRIFDVGDAESAGGDDAIVEDADGDTGHVELAHPGFGERDDGVEAILVMILRGQRRRGDGQQDGNGQETAIHVRDYSGDMRSVIAISLVVLAVVLASAHEKFKIVGSVVGLKNDEIAVKAIDGATYEIDMDESTPITDKNHKRIKGAKLVVGEKVVVQALGHDMFDLEAFEIQLVER